MSVRKGSNIIAAYGSGSGGNADYINNQNLESENTKFYDWIGTLEEYEEQEVAELHSDWVCFITDDEEGGDSVYTKTEMDTLLNAKLNSSETEFIAHQSMPSNEYIDLTLGANESEYTAQADGYFTWQAKPTDGTTGFRMTLMNKTTRVCSGIIVPSAPVSNTQEIFIPVSKNDNIQIVYYNLTNVIFRFVYANGSK